MQLSVESTAYGALTVIIIIVAGGVLVLMVALRIVQRLRGKPDTDSGAARRPADRRVRAPALRDAPPPPDAARTAADPGDVIPAPGHRHPGRPSRSERTER